MVSVGSGSKLFVSGGTQIVSDCIQLTMQLVLSVRHEESWDEDNTKTVTVYRLESAPVEKEPGYMLITENRAVYKRDDSYTPNREFEEPLPGEDEEPGTSVSAAKVAMCQKVHDLQCEILSGFDVDACREYSHSKVENIIQAVQTKDDECPICHKQLKDGAAVRTHLRAKHQQKTPYQCQLCQQYCADNQLLKAHLKIHSDADKFKCHEEGCGKGFPTKGRLNSHAKTHDAKLHVKCQYCNKVFNEKKNVKPHEKTCRQRPTPAVRDVKCELCPKAFFHQKDLKYHMKKTHPGRSGEKL